MSEAVQFISTYQVLLKEKLSIHFRLKALHKKIKWNTAESLHLQITWWCANPVKLNYSWKSLGLIDNVAAVAQVSWVMSVIERTQIASTPHEATKPCFPDR